MMRIHTYDWSRTSSTINIYQLCYYIILLNNNNYFYNSCIIDVTSIWICNDCGMFYDSKWRWRHMSRDQKVFPLPARNKENKSSFGRDGQFKKVLSVRTGPNWTDISVLWTHFSVLSDAVRTALSQKRYVWRKKKGLCNLCMFALYGQIFKGQFFTKIQQCTRMFATEC